MPFDSKKHILPALLLLLIFASGPMTMAETLEDQLESTKTNYKDLWDVAANATEKRASLEAELATFDDRVGEAKRSIEEIGQARRDIREQISGERDRLGEIEQQMQLVSDADGYYSSLAVRIRQGLADFAKFVAIREIVSESGPAGSSVLLRPFLSGSLGEHIDDALARDAVLRARAELLTQASVMTTEAGRVREQLIAMAGEYTLHLAALEKEQMKLGKDANRAAEYVDQSWMKKVLTEAELSSVAEEAKEASAQVAAMQDDLLRINDELKEQKLKVLREQEAQTMKDLAAFESEIDTLERRDTAMRLLEEAALRALQDTVKLRNTDTRNLYQKIDVQELQQKNLKEERAILSAAPVPDAVAIEVIDRKLLVIQEILLLMRKGVPEETARDYVSKKAKAEQATVERTRLALSIVELKGKQAQVSRALSTVVAGIDSVEAQFGLDGLPPVFVWPVKGPITAGFLDALYVRIFGVPHKALDIAVKQGTPVRAATDGIVHKVREGGAKGYSYVLIGHRNGYATLYGHVSAFLVSAGDIVKAGQPIALSGGTPGTNGAGYMTTGAHVHFEVLREGVNVDPMTVLP